MDSITHINLNSSVCLLCKNTGMDFVNILRDDDTRCAAKCKYCGHIQLAPLPTAEEDEQFYKTNQMMKNVFKDIDTLQTEEQLMYRMELFVREQADTLCKYLPVPSDDYRILEIGSGYGWLPQFLTEKGYNVTGIEINEVKRELCKKRCGIGLSNCNILIDEPNNRHERAYDAVLIMQTLEHIYDPKLFLTRAGQLLKSGGTIYVDVPNYNDWYKKYQNEYKNWSFFRSHVSYFTPEMLSSVLVECGFNNITVYGHQPHSIENALHWWRNKEPNLL